MGENMDTQDTSDYKISKSGRKVRAHKIVFNHGEEEKPKQESTENHTQGNSRMTYNQISEMIAKARNSATQRLKGKQHKIDMNKNGKIDAEDFEHLRKMKKEEVENVVEGSTPKEKQRTPYRDITSPEYKQAASKQREDMKRETATNMGKDLLKKILKKKMSEDVNLDEEQLDELKKTTLLSYANKAIGRKDAIDFARGSYMAGRDPNSERIADLRKRSIKTGEGISRAMRKMAFQKEDMDLDEAVSQRHPLEDHPYHKKSESELRYIMKDAGEAAQAMKGHSPRAEAKYLDQVNDAATVLNYRKTSGMPDWYKKKYAHIKEDTELSEEQLDEILKKGDPASKWIKDFISSDNPKFKDKTRKERMQMALGAYYAAQRNEERREMELRAISEMISRVRARLFSEQAGEIYEESLTAGKRLISKHGSGEHTAKVYKDTEYDEYQVHFYKNGKHMGEGPVSYHDDKEDAQATAAHALKKMNESVQLDELSQDTLSRYMKGARKDINSKTRFGDAPENSKRLFDINKRVKGYRSAWNKMDKKVNEDLSSDSEHIEEADMYDDTKTNHSVKKTSTGTVYTKKYDGEGNSLGSGFDAASKMERAFEPKKRGRPAGSKSGARK